MKISNRLFSEQQLNLLSRQMEDIQSVQSKISSGKNIVFASDDPVGAVELSGLKDVSSQVQQYIENAELSLNRIKMMDSSLEAIKNVFIRSNELAIQASNDVLAPSDRESIALEFDELKKELISLANTKDSRGTYLFSGFKTKTPPFVLDSDGSVTYKGDRGVISLPVSESRMLESTIDGGTVFQDIVTSTGVSTDLFESLDNISRSIRTASSGVEAAKAEGIAKITLTNEDPGTYMFKITSGSKSADFSIAITDNNLSDVASAINSADLDITATLEDSNTTLKLTNTFSYDITMSDVHIPGITKAQDQSTSFFSFQPVDASGNSLGNSQTLYDFDQTIASRLDEMVTIQNHLSNQRAKVGARINSAERQSDVMRERLELINNDISELADADLAELVTRLQAQLTGQEASQKAFVRISRLNLFDHLS